MKRKSKQKKQFISLVLAFIMIFNILPINVFAATKGVPEGTPIRTEEELKNINLGDDGVYYLANDIVLSQDWTTLPDFKGVLDGNGYKITGLNITKADITQDSYGYETHNYGLFSKITASGEVRNLGIEGKISIPDEKLDDEKIHINAGLLAGLISNDYYNPNNIPRIQNIWAKGEITSPNNLENKDIGALVGIYNSGIADNCFTQVKDTPIIGSGVIQKISNMYYDRDFYTGPNNIEGVTGKTTDFMESQDFVDLLNTSVGDNNPKWIIVNGNTPRQEGLEISPEQTVREIEIYTEEDLLKINNDLSGKYKLMNDIELTSENWELIGGNGQPFSGTLDGNGYKIKNLKYSGQDHTVGFIAESTGVIKNLGIENVNMVDIGINTDIIGAIVGLNKGTIENCYVLNSNIQPHQFTTNSGLIAGNNKSGTIKNSYAVGKGVKHPICNSSGTYENCYYDKNVFEKDSKNPVGVIEKLTDEMKTQEFVDLLNRNKGENLEWDFLENNYPTIKNKSDETEQDKPNEEFIESNNKLINELTNNIVDSLKDTTDPWAIMSMAANGNKDDLIKLNQFMKEAYTNIEYSTGKDATEIERYIIGLSSISKDSRKIINGDKSINAIESLGKTNIDLINAMIFALIAYDSGDYEISSSSKYTKEELINTIISRQTSNGGWALSGREIDTDITAMTVSALAPYYIANDYNSTQISEETYNNVKQSVDKSIKLLSDLKLEDGSYSSNSNPINSNSNSTSMVITAMSALGIDVQRDSRFIKGGKNPIDGLLKFKTDDNLGFGFKNNKYNAMATEQGLRAIVSYNNYSKEKQPYNIYTFNKGFLEEIDDTENPEINENPIINGAKDIIINIGDTFNPKDGITANDKEDGDLTSEIVIHSEVDIKKAGTYTLIYEVTDKDGNTTTKEILVTVIDKSKPIEKISVGIYTDEKSLYESAEVNYHEGDTAYTVLKRLMGDKVDSIGTGETIYVKGIDKLYEFDKGPSSGWVYAVNRVMPGVSAGVQKLNPGDELIWHYTLDLGNDINKSYNKFDEFLGGDDKPQQNKAPIINAVDIQLTVGEKFDPLKNVTATDKEGRDITKSIKIIENTVDTSREGTYKVVYEVTDNEGSKTIKEIKVVVKIFEQSEIVGMIKNASKWILKNFKNPGYQDEWKVLGLKRGDIEVPSGYYETYYNNLIKLLKENQGNLHKIKYTEYSRVIITLTALGYDPTDVGGYNLVEKLFDLDKVSKQGINGVIFALIALDTKDFEIKGSSNSRDMMINYIIDRQLSDGGFALTGDKGEVDITAMAIQALSNYKDIDYVKLSINKALNFLSKSQLNTGGFGTYEGETVESSAQVLVALNTLGISVNDDRFIKVGNTIVDAIKRFEVKQGGFKHLLSQDTADSMATEQALYALVSQDRLNNKKTSIYDMSDVILEGVTNPGGHNNEVNNEGVTNSEGHNNEVNNEGVTNSGEHDNNPQTSDTSILQLVFLALMAIVGISIINRKRA